MFLRKKEKYFPTTTWHRPDSCNTGSHIECIQFPSFQIGWTSIKIYLFYQTAYLTILYLFTDSKGNKWCQWFWYGQYFSYVLTNRKKQHDNDKIKRPKQKVSNLKCISLVLPIIWLSSFLSLIIPFQYSVHCLGLHLSQLMCAE